MSFLFGEGRYNPEIKIETLTNNLIEFYLCNADLSFANALRRTIISEVPTMSIDMVNIKENTSPLFDEFITHRLGLIPLISKDIDNYEYSLRCNCNENEGCEKCKVDFVLKVRCDNMDKRDVTSNDIIPLNKNCSVVPVKFPEPIVICKLKRNQVIDMTMTAKKGIGKEHAKWSPVCGCVMQQVPEIQFIEKNDILKNKSKEEKEEFIKSCPSNVFRYDERTNLIKIEKPLNCTYCEECLLKLDEMCGSHKDIIKIEPKKNVFRFKVESTGSLTPEKIVEEGFKSLINKIKGIDEALDNINS